MSFHVREWLRLIRPAQWVKNVLVLAPLFFSGRLFAPGAASRALLTSACFCVLASAIYVFNDLRDVAADRSHATKRRRPLASGTITVTHAVAVMVVLAVSAAAAAVMGALPWSVRLILLVYAIVNLGYSCGLKQVPILELFVVASGFVLRLLAGGEAVDVPLSPWILVCTALLALLIVIGKRRADLVLGNDASLARRSLTGYTVAYLDHLLVAVASVTLMSYLLFCTSEYGQGRFGNHVVLTAVFVAFGIFRYLQIVFVNRSGDSPTELLVRDPVLLVTTAAWAVAFVPLIYVFR